ncbi:50S ribosomal protein L6 [Candidatus Micrarchaeota archaeon]|nr:50S ribosomal protein L6 [Candidatus Micrarchaeota archaeon]
MMIMAEYEITVPQNVTVTVTKNDVAVKGKLGEIKRSFKLERVKANQSGETLTLKIEDAKTQEKANLGSIASHIKNMIDGVERGHKYMLKILYKHFPINVSIEKDRVVIKNFAGEKKPRFAKIVGASKVVLKGDIIEIDGKDIEEVGQTAANIEQATRIRKKDIRIFQDGIFITKKSE